MYRPHFLKSFRTKLQTPCVMAPTLWPQPTSSIEHFAVALAQEKSVGRGAGGWCLGSRNTVALEMDTFFFFMGDRFSNPKDVGFSQAGVEGSEAVRQRCKKVTSSSRRPSPQRYLRGLSISRWPRVWTQCVPRTCGQLQQYCCVQQFLFFYHTW